MIQPVSPRLLLSLMCLFSLLHARTPAMEPSDCNGNGIPDSEEIAAGLVADCNQNGIPEPCGFDSDEPAHFDVGCNRYEPCS